MRSNSHKGSLSSAERALSAGARGVYPKSPAHSVAATDESPVRQRLPSRYHPELRTELDCAWQQIYERARQLGILERFEAIAPPHDWSTALEGGPRRVVREDLRVADSEEGS